MGQVGIPQKNLQEPLAGDYEHDAAIAPGSSPPASFQEPAVPAEAGQSSFILGQNLVEAIGKEASKPTSDVAPIPHPYRLGTGLPDQPNQNTDKVTQVPSTATDANGNRISDSDRVQSAGTEKGAFDILEQARPRANEGSDLIKNHTVPAAPRTTGVANYGAMSGGTPEGAKSDGYGNEGNTQASFPDIDRAGSRNHANLHVVSRPGATHENGGKLI